MVGSKEISLRQGIEVSKVDQWIDNALSNGGQSESTVEELLGHSQVKKHGTFGRLSASQQNLVTSVVSIMQDRVSTDAKNNAETLKEIILAEREALKAMSHSFTSAAKSLYKLPLIASAAKEDAVIKDVVSDNAPFSDAIEETVESVDTQRNTGYSWGNFLTWGNMISVTAIVLLIWVVKISVETANFETQYLNAASEVERLSLELEEKEGQYNELGEKFQRSQIEIAGLIAEMEGDKKRAAEKVILFESTIEKQEQTIAQLEALSTATRDSLSKEIKVLQTEVALLKGKELDKSHKSDIWKQLANERKEELNKLQSQIVALSELTRSSKAAEKEDKGWSLF